MLSRFEYGPFGENNALSGTEFGYTGQQYDVETGLLFYKARHYSPELGRFLQPDPLGYGDTLNSYLYVGNDPTNFVDPLGLIPELPDNPTEQDLQNYIKKLRSLEKGNTDKFREKIWNAVLTGASIAIGGGGGGAAKLSAEIAKKYAREGIKTQVVQGSKKEIHDLMVKGIATGMKRRGDTVARMDSVWLKEGNGATYMKADLVNLTKKVVVEVKTFASQLTRQQQTVSPHISSGDAVVKKTFDEARLPVGQALGKGWNFIERRIFPK